MLKQEKIEIRNATLDDVDALTELSHRTVLTKYPSVIGKEMVEGYVASGAVPQYYRDRVDHCRVAEFNGKPIGTYALKEDSLDLMMVALEHHRSGVGRQLLKEAETRLFARFSDIFLNSFRDNIQAVEFYKAHSWSVESEFVDPDYGIPMVKMTKTKS